MSLISRILRVAVAFVAISILLFPSECRADIPDFTTKVLTVKDGLTQNGITDIFRDSRGFLWVGTRYGLNRYDTHTVNKYFADNTRNSISGNGIYRILEDRNGYVWIFSTSNIDVYDPATSTFTERTIDGKSISGRSAFPVEDGFLIGGIGNIMHYSYDTDSVSVIPLPEGSPEMYISIHPWKNDTYLLHARRDGLWVYDPAKNTLERCEEIPIRNITTVKLDPKGNLWISPYGQGLECYDKSGKLLTRIGVDDGLSSSMVIDMQVNGNELMIGTEHGLDVVDLSTYKLTHCARSGFVNHYGSINKIFVDDWGNQYLGTVRNGVIIIQATTMHTFRMSPAGEVENTVTSFVPGLGTDLICGLDGYGLVLFDRATSTPRPVPGSENMKVIGLANWSPRKVLVSDWGSPLKIYDKVSNRLEPMPSFLKEISDHAIANRLGINIINKTDGRIIVVTDRVIIIDPETSAMEVLREVSNNSSGNMNGNMNPFYSDDKCILTIRGARILYGDFVNGTITELFKSPDGYAIQAVAYDGKDTLYLATLESFYSYSISKNTCIRIPSERLRNIRSLHLHKGNLWIGANSKLFRMSQDRVISFDEGNGVAPSDMRPAAFYEDSTYIYLGSTSGLIRVNKAKTDSLLNVPVVAGPIHLAELYVNDAEALPDLKDGVITVPPVHSTVQIKIIATEHSPIRNKRYRFTIIGADYPAPLETTTPDITVSDLPAGSTVKVMASYTLSDGTWSEPQYVLTIKVQQLWWRTWWFILLVIIVVGCILFLAYRVIRQRWISDSDRQRRHMLERDVQILANINHSLRTPIDKIASPINKSLESLSSGGDIDVPVLKKQLAEALEQVEMMHDMVDSPFEILHSQNLSLTSMNLTARFNKWLVEQLDAFVRAHRIDSRIDFTFLPDCDRGTITFNASRLEIVINSLLTVFVEEGRRNLVVGIQDDNEDNLYISFTYRGGQLPDLDALPQEGENLQLVYARWIAELDNDKVITLLDDDGKLKGAIFVVPAVKSQRTPAMVETVREEADGIVREIITNSADFSDKTLFILESDAGTANFLRSCTESMFRSVTVMDDAAEGEKYVSEYMPDIVILDGDTELDGSLEICRVIKSTEDMATIPVIMLTSSDLHKIKEASFLYGADAYLEKPFDRSVLVDLCHTLLLSNCQS